MGDDARRDLKRRLVDAERDEMSSDASSDKLEMETASLCRSPDEPEGVEDFVYGEGVH